ncbi:MAG: glycosyltransferase [Balneolaceae bacterium]|nr:MAG: glycosyltransferase [Balneolaceae bacterium]
MVSIVMPVRNAADTVQAALDSLAAQTLTAWECIAVNDSSDDATAAILDAAAAGDKRIIPVSSRGTGIVDALNTGIAMASAPVIARMDADDISLPARLERQYEHLLANPGTGLVSCLVEHGGSSRRQAGYARYVRWINTLITHEQISLNRFVESPLAHPAVMFRKQLVKDHGGYRNGAFPEDYELWLRWLEAGVRMEKVPEKLFYWSDRDDRLSRTDERYSITAFYGMKTGYLARWLAANNPHHPHVVVWGAGRTTRKRVELLQELGIRVTRFIDINPVREGTVIHGIPVSMPDGLPPPEECFVLSYVGSAGARELIGAELKEKGFLPGTTWLPVA